MKCLFVLFAFVFASVAVSAQTTDKAVASPEAAKLDSLAKLSQRFMNNNQPDSLYALMGATFKQNISLEKVKEVTGQLAGQLGKWVSLEPRGVQNGVARYKAVFALAAMDFYISRDKEGKIETFLFKQLQD